MSRYAWPNTAPPAIATTGSDSAPPATTTITLCRIDVLSRAATSSVPAVMIEW
jgi:hypothetical protein